MVRPERIDPRNFDLLHFGKQVGLFTLENAQGMLVEISNYGARLVSLWAPNSKGDFGDVILGFNSIHQYLESTQPYFGASIGRYSNRIAGAQFSLDGMSFKLIANEGENQLHGGPGGFHNRVWDLVSNSPNHLILKYLSQDAEEGYPGNLQVQVNYTLTDHNELIIDYLASCDQATPISLTNHAFFNLGDAGLSTINEHLIQINAERYAPVNEQQIPTGELKGVENGPFDFRQLKSISHNLRLIEDGGGFDHSFELNGSGLRKAATVIEPLSGRVMEISTTEPALQFYGGNYLDGSIIGKHGICYGKHSAFCLETQAFPDSPNQANFPLCILRPGMDFKSTTAHRFSIQA